MQPHVGHVTALKPGQHPLLQHLVALMNRFAVVRVKAATHLVLTHCVFEFAQYALRRSALHFFVTDSLTAVKVFTPGSIFRAFRFLGSLTFALAMSSFSLSTSVCSRTAA